MANIFWTKIFGTMKNRSCSGLERRYREKQNESDKSCAEQHRRQQLSIPDAEEIIEEALGELAFSQDPGLVRALRFLAPPGYQAIVELCSENGRSKRRNASAESWSPEEDEVRIYFERTDEAGASLARVPFTSRNGRALF